MANAINWTAWDAILGTDTDRAVAVVIGCHRQTVKARRRKLKIASAHPEKSSKGKVVNWAFWDARIGGLTDREAAGLIGCSLGTVNSRRHKLGLPGQHLHIRWDKKKLKLLKTKRPNAEIASSLGITENAVRMRRLRDTPTSRAVINWRQWDQSIGKVSDGELAKQIGYTSEAVRQRRIYLGIHKHRKDDK